METKGCYNIVVHRLPRRLTNRGFSLVEVVISLFLLSFVALVVLSMTQTSFLHQKRNQDLAKASLLASRAIAEIRIWAQDVDHFQSDWSAYNTVLTYPEFPNHEVEVRSFAMGLPLDTPSDELESQWEGDPRGTKTLPRAVVPVEITVRWSGNERDAFRILTYVAEPWRDATGATFNITGPSPSSLGTDQTAAYAITAQDAAGRPFENLLFSWRADSRYFSHAPDSPRTGRQFRVVRDKVVKPPTSPPPVPPEVSPVQCYASFGGVNIPIVPQGVRLP